MVFYRRHIIDILRIKFHATTMRLGEKIVFQGALELVATTMRSISLRDHLSDRNLPAFPQARWKEGHH